ncbi:unnamed protein product [Dimorphilus gyrociliatus]|uniref:Uncharacterized protein n=1 Tax=Dimorphilus gyrociliatus TaxID=2664684 RepID=A0A7I8W2U8_9ANNE|nr:unnamed protein product [Dimorphilus gyrociliatus]
MNRLTTTIGLLSTALAIWFGLLSPKTLNSFTRFQDMNIKWDSMKFNFETDDSIVRLSGQFGRNLKVLASINPCPDELYDNGAKNCIEFTGESRLEIEPQLDNSGRCYRIKWTPLNSNFIPEDCIDINKAYWYGGASVYEQHWPINKQKHRMTAYVSGDILAPAELNYEYGGVLERYWISSKGAGIYVQPDIPLHVGFNDNSNGLLCLKSSFEAPYLRDSQASVKSILDYTICLSDNVKSVHKVMSKKFFDKPQSVPDERMFKSPVWSTWAKYKMNVNINDVKELAEDINRYEMANSQIEIDDKFSTFYGEFDFDPVKFPNVSSFINEIKKSMNFRVTAWIVPFANNDSEAFREGDSKGYWVKNVGGRTEIVKWWQGFGGLLDVTNPEATKWFIKRLEKFRSQSNIDSFKFDAGEANYVPPNAVFYRQLINPTSYATYYAQLVFSFGSQIETRIGFQSQKFGIFVRMFDKHSSWGFDNGLASLIPNALQFGIVGYPFILPDMIGGNGYSGNQDEWTSSTKLPSKELFIRWMLLTACLPAMQFSFVPWQYDNETIKIGKDAIHLHETLITPAVLRAAAESVSHGFPIIRPIWWLEPNEDKALRVEDQFLIGNELLIAPIIMENSRYRNIYLPSGNWQDKLRNELVTGGKTLLNYYLDLHEVAIFRRIVL